MSRPRVTDDDLLFAADWIECYEPGDDTEAAASIARLIDWIEAELDRWEHPYDLDCSGQEVAQ